MTRKQRPRARSDADETTSSAAVDSGQPMSPALAEASGKLFSIELSTQSARLAELVKAQRAGHPAPPEPVELVAARAEFVRASLAQDGVLDGLSSEQQQRLAELVIELTKGADVVPWARTITPNAKRCAKHGPGYIRVLTRKTKAARAALEDVRRYLTKIDFPTFKLHLMKKIPFDSTLTAATTVLDPTAMRLVGERVISHLADLASTKPTLTLADATEALTTFLVNECGLGKYEADRRTALIGKSWWDWNVAIDNEWTQGEPGAPGSGAIRKRRARRLRRDTPKKIR